MRNAYSLYQMSYLLAQRKVDARPFIRPEANIYRLYYGKRTVKFLKGGIEIFYNGKKEDNPRLFNMIVNRVKEAQRLGKYVKKNKQPPYTHWEMVQLMKGDEQTER